MADLNFDRAKTAVLSMDIQEAPVRKSSMFRERNVGLAAKSVLEAARKAGVLVIHAVIDYQPVWAQPFEQRQVSNQTALAPPPRCKTVSPERKGVNDNNWMVKNPSSPAPPRATSGRQGRESASGQPAVALAKTGGLFQQPLSCPG
jgi:hypothetical protein